MFMQWNTTLLCQPLENSTMLKFLATDNRLPADSDCPKLHRLCLSVAPSENTGQSILGSLFYRKLETCSNSSPQKQIGQLSCEAQRNAMEAKITAIISERDELNWALQELIQGKRDRDKQMADVMEELRALKLLENRRLKHQITVWSCEASCNSNNKYIW